MVGTRVERGLVTAKQLSDARKILRHDRSLGQAVLDDRMTFNGALALIPGTPAEKERNSKIARYCVICGHRLAWVPGQGAAKVCSQSCKDERDRARDRARHHGDPRRKNWAREYRTKTRERRNRWARKRNHILAEACGRTVYPVGKHPRPLLRLTCSACDRSMISTRQKLFCDTCLRERDRARAAEKRELAPSRRPNPKLPFHLAFPRTCVICGQSFMGHPDGLTCSALCAGRRHNAIAKERYRNKPKKPCLICTKPLPAGRSVVCSHYCRKTRQDQRFGTDYRRAHNKQYQAANRERLNAYAKHYYAANRERLRDVARQYRLDHPDEVRDAKRAALRKQRAAVEVLRELGVLPIRTVPSRYSDLIDSGLDAVLEDSFPASDPPPYSVTGIKLARETVAAEFCRRGHELIAENVYIRPSGRRECRQCRNPRAGLQCSRLKLSEREEREKTNTARRERYKNDQAYRNKISAQHKIYRNKNKKARASYDLRHRAKATERKRQSNLELRAALQALRELQLT